MKKFQCAVIGCGRIGCGFDDIDNKSIITHAGAYFKNPKTELVALCDVDKNKLKKYGQKYRVKNTFTDSEIMFKENQIDFVSICTLVDTHLPFVKQAAKYGIKGIFLEKPASDNLRNMKEVLKICKKYKITLLVDHQRRFNPIYHKIAKFLKEKKLGEIQFSKIYYGGGIANTGTHIFDLLRLFFGDVKSIKAEKSENKSHFSHDPNLNVDLKFSNNVFVKMIALNLNNYGICEIDILGTRGRLRINLINDEIEYFKKMGDNPLSYKELLKTNFPIKKSQKSAIMLGLENMIDAYNGKKSILSSGNDGYGSLELIIAAMKSANSGKIFKIPLKDNSYKIKSK